MPLGVRRMPDSSWLNWVVLQRGPSQNDIPRNTVIGDYWTNRNKDYYGKKVIRPGPQEFKYINNQDNSISYPTLASIGTSTVIL